MILLISFLISFVALQVKTNAACADAEGLLMLPECAANECLREEHDKLHNGICPGDLGSYCDIPDGKDIWGKAYSSCIVERCVSDLDIHMLLVVFKDACEDRKFGPLKSLGGILGDPIANYLKDIVPSSATSTSKSSTQKSSTQKSSTQKSSTPSANSKEDQTTSTTPSSTSDSKPSTSSAPLPPPPPPESKPPNSEPSSSVPAPNTSPDATQVTHSTLETSATSDSPAYSSAAAASTSPTPSSTPTIAGAAAGGTAFLALALGALFYLLRRRKRAQPPTSTPQHWNPDVGVGRPTLPDIHGVYEKEGNGLERYANPTRGVSRGHVQHASVQQGSIHHQASTERMKFNGSPYPELGTGQRELNTPHHKSNTPHHELESPQPHVSPQQGWNGASEVHAESRSPVIELEGMGPIVRMEGENGRGRYYARTNF